MFGGENTIGTILLTACGVVAAILIWQILTGNRLTWHGPGWLPPVIGIVSLAALIWAWFNAPRRL
jgi:hypothetical protein